MHQRISIKKQLQPPGEPGGTTTATTSVDYTGVRIHSVRILKIKRPSVVQTEGRFVLKVLVCSAYDLYFQRVRLHYSRFGTP